MLWCQVIVISSILINQSECHVLPYNKVLSTLKKKIRKSNFFHEMIILKNHLRILVPQFFLFQIIISFSLEILAEQQSQ